MRQIPARIAATVVLTALLLGFVLPVAHAQIGTRAAGDDLRVEWSAAEDRRGRPVVTGFVYNRRAGVYAVGTRLRVEALDDAGGVVGSTTGSVIGDVPPSSRSYFEIKAPARAARYRVMIDSFEWRGYGAGGG
jgi:hypothetical protein